MEFAAVPGGNAPFLIASGRFHHIIAFAKYHIGGWITGFTAWFFFRDGIGYLGNIAPGCRWAVLAAGINIRGTAACDQNKQAGQNRRQSQKAMGHIIYSFQNLF